MTADDDADLNDEKADQQIGPDIPSRRSDQDDADLNDDDESPAGPARSRALPDQT